MHHFHSLTIDWCFSWQNDHDQLQPSVSVLEVSEHGLHAVGSLGIFTEAGLPLDWHSSIPGNLPQLLCEGPGQGTEIHCIISQSKPILIFDLIFVTGTILLNLQNCAVKKTGNLTPCASLIGQYAV